MRVGVGRGIGTEFTGLELAMLVLQKPCSTNSIENM